MLQVVKSFVCDLCKQNAAQKNRHATTDEQGCATTPKSEDRSSQSKAELETVGAAGKDEQMLGARKKVSEVSTLTEDSGVASESQPSASSTDVTPSPTKINPIANSNNSKTKNAALMNRNEDTLVNNYDQQKDVDDYEFYVADMHDAENEIWEDGICKNGFKDTDYVRGHLAAAANHMWCQEAYKDTYLISNMTPQLKSINNGIWKMLENYCRKIIYKDEVRNVHVYTGPLYLNSNEGLTMEGKAVPTHYFKVVIVENVNGKAKVECYMAPQTTDLNVYRMNIGEFQRVSGLTFIEHGLNLGDTDRIITVTLQGEDLNQTQHNVNIGVRITHNVNR
uniref:Uncharacterized protein n=1 Tax=Sinocyclocheilus grahami TaxID=75366 RepID=A0A672KLY3_SINGR